MTKKFHPGIEHKYFISRAELFDPYSFVVPPFGPFFANLGTMVGSLSTLPAQLAGSVFSSLPRGGRDSNVLLPNTSCVLAPLVGDMFSRILADTVSCLWGFYRQYDMPIRLRVASSSSSSPFC